jgi:hypothetical protein
MQDYPLLQTSSEVRKPICLSQVQYGIVCNKNPLFYKSAHCKKYRYLSPTPIFHLPRFFSTVSSSLREELIYLSNQLTLASTVSHIIHEFYTYDELSTT